jgi:hypothetical protein
MNQPEMKELVVRDQKINDTHTHTHMLTHAHFTICIFPWPSQHKLFKQGRKSSFASEDLIFIALFFTSQLYKQRKPGC